MAARDSYLELAGAVSQRSRLKEPGGEATVAELVAAELARPLYAQLIADRPRTADAGPAGSPLALAGPDRPAAPGDQRRGGRSVAGCGPALPGREDRPAAARPVDRLAALVVPSWGRRPSGPVTSPTS